MRPRSRDAVLAGGAVVLAVAAVAGAARDRRLPSAPRIEGPRVTTSTRPSYRFSATEPGTPASRLRFRCAFDRVRLHACARTYSQQLRLGTHTLRARAVDPAGNAGRLTRVLVRVIVPRVPPPPPPPGPATLTLFGPATASASFG